MASYEAIKGQTVSIDLLEDYRNNGWTISGGKAIHEGCNSGLIELLNVNYTPNVPNTFKYTVSGRTSGSVNIRVETVDGISRSTNGEFTEVLTPNNGDRIYFYSDGNLTLETLSISPVKSEGTTNARTFGFDERNKRWIGDFSYHPEFMLNFVDKFITFKDGDIWWHNINEVRNNFYGVQYSSIITFYCNLTPKEIKTFFGVRLKSDKVWSLTDIQIPPRYGKQQGQKSRIKKGNFKSLQGDWFSDFLRDMNDQRFSNSLEALMNGAELQGGIMKITMENTNTDSFRLLAVDIIVSPSENTY